MAGRLVASDLGVSLHQVFAVSEGDRHVAVGAKPLNIEMGNNEDADSVALVMSRRQFTLQDWLLCFSHTSKHRNKPKRTS